MFKINKKSFRNPKVKFSVKTVNEGHHNVTYRGVKAVRCPFDYVIYQMIICEIKPDLIIEIGTRKGGTTLYMADLLDSLNHGAIHTIDITNDAAEIVRKHGRISFYNQGWENYDLDNASKFEKILIIEDASHIYEDTLGVMKKFHELISVGSYFIIEDGIINELGLEKEYNGGPLRAISEFIESNSNFVIDRSWCDFFGTNATFNVNGYLRRQA